MTTPAPANDWTSRGETASRAACRPRDRAPRYTLKYYFLQALDSDHHALPCSASATVAMQCAARARRSASVPACQREQHRASAHAYTPANLLRE